VEPEQMDGKALHKGCTQARTGKCLPVSRPKSRVGFSLLEVMIALAIFSIVALALAQYQSYLVKKRVVSRRYTQAVNYAEQKVEELRNAGYSAISAGTTTESSVSGDTNFRRITTVAAYTYYKTITVEVEWKTPEGTTYHTPVVLKTLLAE